MLIHTQRCISPSLFSFGAEWREDSSRTKKKQPTSRRLASHSPTLPGAFQAAKTDPESCQKSTAEAASGRNQTKQTNTASPASCRSNNCFSDCDNTKPLPQPECQRPRNPVFFCFFDIAQNLNEQRNTNHHHYLNSNS